MEQTGTKEAQASLVLDALREDHQRVKRLFDEFESARGRDEKQRIVERALRALEEHSYVEEKVLYPAFTPALDDEQLMDEALEEHHVAHLLAAELKTMSPSDPRFDAKFMVLAENVKHHIEKEEGEMFTQVGEGDFDWAYLSEKASAARQQFSSRSSPSGKQNGKARQRGHRSSFRTSTTSAREAN